MNMTDDWPSYYSGKRDHLHALGVIALSYSAFERSLQALYAHHAQQQKIPNALADLYYTSLNELGQLKAIRAIFKAYDEETETVALVNNLLDFFDWCSKARNELLHSEFYPAMFGGDPDRLYLIKRKSKKESAPTYHWPTVKELRQIADHIEEGKRQCAGIIIYLRLRDIPIGQLPQAYQDIQHELPPPPLVMPPPLHVSLQPHYGQMPEHIRSRKLPS